MTTDGSAADITDTITINGDGHTVTAGGSEASSTNFIINNSGDATINNTGFENGNVTGNGGAIKNASTMTIQNGSSFTSNASTENGGAIYNTGTLKIDDTTFTSNIADSNSESNSTGKGGAIYNNNGSVTISDSTFNSNEARVSGGAIYNQKGKVNISENSTFTLNSSDAGGAIINSDQMEIYDSTFTSNEATVTYGGAIYNSNANANTSTNTVDLTIENSSFNYNSAKTGGGAIANAGTTDSEVHNLTIINSKFEGNYSGSETDTGLDGGSGGAIYNSGRSYSTGSDGVTSISDNSTFVNNTAAYGGAIYNSGDMTIDDTTFTTNTSTSNGGAITNTINVLGYSTADLSISNSTFDTNSSVNGGAIYNNGGTVSVSNSNFINNTATTGGAFYNASGTVTISDSTMTGNKAASLNNGGAIYNAAGATTNIIATSGNSSIIGNSDSVSNGTDSISLDGTSSASSTLNLLTESNGTIEINSNILGNASGDTADATLYSDVNVNDNSGTYTGTVKVGSEAQIINSNIKLYDGTLSFASDLSLVNTSSLYLHSGTLDMLNYSVNDLSGRSFSLLGDTNIALDVDIANQSMDTILSSNFNDNFKVENDATLTISNLYSVSDTSASDVTILFTDATELIGNVELASTATTISGPIYQYSVEHISVSEDSSSSNDAAVISDDASSTGTGVFADAINSNLSAGEYLVFNQLGFSDSAMIGSVASQAAYMLQTNLYRQSFANMDMITLLTPEERMAMKLRNKIAASQQTAAFEGITNPYEAEGVYVRPFSNFESVPLNNGPKVSNISYGTLIGSQSELLEYKGWDYNYSIFGAYHGSHQTYNDVGIWQNGGTLGLVGTAYKGNFWAGATANVGASSASATSEFGREHFSTLMTGAAVKTGYNIPFLDNKLILQPSYMMSYTFVNTFNYMNASGLSVTSDPLHAIEIIPGLKIIGNLGNGWQPYLAANMTWNIMNGGQFYANNVALSQLSIDPFVEYGIGLQKFVGDRFTGFFQCMMRNGGRTGVALTMGLRWALGDI